MIRNFEVIEELSNKYVELKNKNNNESEKIFNTDFIKNIKNILEEKCKPGESIPAKKICDELDLDPSMKTTICSMIKFQVIPGFKIVRGRNGGITKIDGVYKDEKKEFKDYQRKCLESFKSLIMYRANRYKQFSNYEDLIQDGFEALMLALETYDPSKGSFVWWADHYIKTKISRAANNHSTIRVPIKFAKKEAPHKETSLPTLCDFTYNPHKCVEQKEVRKNILEAINILPEKHKKLMELTFGLNGECEQDTNDIMSAMSLTYPQYMKIYNESKKIIKRHFISNSKS
jgi:RNA polymerase sigma factor (sigma-70 family)